ncbi:ADP-ribosylation factor-like protein 6-interacting protein 1 [Oppia nitens]|uniref:ADP-ribosylation factor-like protein 6-interacting protein 1 n=1 Tax=Oppia nitens TaxID=1686743 RepID=UPI0023D9C782|nr:ADP-ribosylation factor-like protein 6-interacting protein 1 [Oppia nitens]
MADSTDSRSSGDTVIQNQLKNHLKDWKHLVVKLYSILIWEASDIYPLAIASVVSTIFLLIWYLDTSILTTLSVIGIVATVMDYGLPIVNHSLFNPNKWSASDEAKFETICTELVNNWTVVIKAYSQWQNTKNSNPKLYYAVLLSTLLSVSWIGNVVHNLLLTYLLVVFVALFPGLKHRGLIDKYLSVAMSSVCKLKRN